MAKAHAFLGFSGAAEWSACPMWARMNATYPDTSDKEAAEWGTAAHWAFEELAQDRVVAEGQITPDGTVLTAEMIECADVVCRVVDEIRKQDPGMPLHVEEYLACPRVHELNGGTPDTWLYSPALRKIWVVEAKMGYDLVEVFENRQLINQAAAVVSALDINGLMEQSTRVEMIVVQPRAYHRDGPVRRWEVLASDLRAQWNILEMAAEDATSEHPMARPGPQCTHCNGRHACEALKRDAYRTAAISERSEPFDLPADAASLELRTLRAAAERLAARITGLEGQIEGLLVAGAAVPGWTLERTPGRAFWTLPAVEVVALGELLGVSLAKPLDTITPAQARKAGIPDEVVSANSDRKTSTKLAPADESLGRRVFG